jgi:5-methylcytosine-specific restriction protein A
MRIIKLSRGDWEMTTRQKVDYYFNFKLRRKTRWGKFGLTPYMRNMPDIRRGTLLVFSYHTELVYLARADGEVVLTGGQDHPYYIPLAMETVESIAGTLANYETALRRARLSCVPLVNTRKWPAISDRCDSFTLRYFDQPPSRGPITVGKYSRLKKGLHQAMENLYEQAGEETGYWGKRYVRAVRKHGGLATAYRMLRPKAGGRIDDGFQALVDAGRADELSVEALVSRPEFRPLFNATELAEATRRLKRIPKSARQIPVAPQAIFPETIDPSKTYVDGRVRTVIVNAYERNPKARAACLQHHGYDCAVCGTNFENVFGKLGRGFIHVHHKKPLGLMRKGYRLRPKIDLVPVCPNCHAMIHAKKPPLTVLQVRAIRNERRIGSKGI